MENPISHPHGSVAASSLSGGPDKPETRLQPSRLLKLKESTRSENHLVEQVMISKSSPHFIVYTVILKQYTNFSLLFVKKKIDKQNTLQVCLKYLDFFFHPHVLSMMHPLETPV